MSLDAALCDYPSNVMHLAGMHCLYAGALVEVLQSPL